MMWHPPFACRLIICPTLRSPGELLAPKNNHHHHCCPPLLVDHFTLRELVRRLARRLVLAPVKHAILSVSFAASVPGLFFGVHAPKCTRWDGNQRAPAPARTSAHRLGDTMVKASSRCDRHRGCSHMRAGCALSIAPFAVTVLLQRCWTIWSPIPRWRLEHLKYRSLMRTPLCCLMLRHMVCFKLVSCVFAAFRAVASATPKGG